MTLSCTCEVRRQAQHTVRVMTSQIGVDEGVGDDLGCASLGASGAKKIAGETVQIRGVDVRHVTSIDSQRVERATRRREDDSLLIASAGSLMGQPEALLDQLQID